MRKAVAPAPEITGLVVLMVAESLVPLAASKFLGIAFEDEPISSHGLAVACCEAGGCRSPPRPLPTRLPPPGGRVVFSAP